MISFFRRALSSWLVLGLLGLIMIAFIVTGVSTNDMGGTTRAGGDTLATVGGRKIGTVEVEQRVQAAFRRAQQETPTLTMPAFIAGGAFDQIVDQVVTGAALEVFGREQGLGASKKLVDGEIASIPGFRGPSGQFDEAAMRAALAQARITEKQMREDIASDTIRRQLLLPVAAAPQVPAGFVAPYASLLLEQRAGTIGIVPTAALAGGPPPPDAEIQAFYARNAARYIVPERRVLRYAVLGADALSAQARPSEADIAAAYRRDAAKYAASEKRTLTQVIADSEAKARAFAAAVAKGQSFAAAATAGGLTPSTRAGLTREALADLASPAVAAAVFGAAQGAVTAPTRSDFGWHVAKVDAIERTAGRSPAQARDEIVAALAADRTKQLVADAAERIDDRLGDGQSFDEVVKAEKLAVRTTPPVTAEGKAPDQAGSAAPADIQPLLKSAFGMDAEDDPVVVPLDDGQRFALLAVAQVVPAAPPPLAAIKARVAADLTAERAHARAKSIADAIAAKANAGATAADAFAQAPVKIGRPVPAGGRRADLTRNGQAVPPPLQLLFSMPQGRTRVLEAPGRQGWWVVTLERIVPGDASRLPALVEATRGQFAELVGQEYLAQFANAARAAMGVKIDQAAIARLKSRMAGGGAPAGE